MNIQQALKELESGETLVTGHTLLKERDGTILVTSDNWTARMDRTDFVHLYQDRDFSLRTSSAAVDEEADLQYYGKLRYRQ